jgi:hypothetical protein
MIAYRQVTLCFKTVGYLRFYIVSVLISLFIQAVLMLSNLLVMDPIPDWFQFN